MKNPLESIASRIRRRVPRATFRLDLADTPRGSSFLDVRLGKRVAVVEWKPAKGFGLSSPPGSGYGSGPDEIYGSARELVKRLVDVLREERNTLAVRDLPLRRLRETRRMTQEQLADRLEVKQATVSKLERRADIYVSTLSRVISALGGKLEMVARFPDESVKLEVPPKER
jgi:DNA-binding XRE family transcriptional regulator